MRNWIGIAIIVLAVLLLPADTTQHPPLRGTNTVRLEAIMPPPLPDASSDEYPRLRRISTDYYVICCSSNDMFFMEQKPEIRRVKGGWRLSFP